MVFIVCNIFKDSFDHLKELLTGNLKFESNKCWINYFFPFETIITQVVSGLPQEEKHEINDMMLKWQKLDNYFLHYIKYFLYL